MKFRRAARDRKFRNEFREILAWGNRKAEDTNALLALRGVQSCLRHLLAPTAAREQSGPQVYTWQGASWRSAGALTGSTTCRPADAAGRHAIRLRYAPYACPVRGEVGRARLGPRVHAHRLRRLGRRMS